MARQEVTAKLVSNNPVYLFEVTMFGETHTVQAVMYGGGVVAMTLKVALAQIGQGKKLHPTHMNLWPNVDGTWRVNLSAVALNQQARIVAWNKPELEKYLSQHRGDSRGVVVE